jgi:hypothetical protein
MELTVRPLAATDFDGFINYWRGLSPTEIETMGVAIDRMPSATRMRSDLERMLQLELGDAAPTANSIRGTTYHLMSRGDQREGDFSR